MHVHIYCIFIHTLQNYSVKDVIKGPQKHIERFHWRHAVLQHGRQIAQTDLDIQGRHVQHALTWSSCAWTTNGEVHGEIITHNNVKRCLHKRILIAVPIEAAMLEDSITSHENTLSSAENQKTYTVTDSFWLSTEHLWTALTPFLPLN